MTAALIDLRGIALDYGAGRVVALRGIDLSIAPGEQVALLGPSGAGKTTLFRLLNLTLPVQRGSYLFAGSDVDGIRGRARTALRAGIATVHQRLDLISRLSVLRNVQVGRIGRWGRIETLRAFIYPRRAEVEEIQRVLVRVGLAEKLHERSDRLSGGQQQRLAIARALFQDAQLVLADEPVSSVDPALAEMVIDLLVRTVKEEGRTLLVNLHQPALATRFFPRIIGLKHGRIAFDRQAREVDAALLADLFADTASPAVAKELSAAIPQRPQP